MKQPNAAAESQGPLLDQGYTEHTSGVMGRCQHVALRLHVMHMHVISADAARVCIVVLALQTGDRC